ncbi:MAG: cytochrome c biogenesis protein CcsA [Candidatus Krumholzibacteriota bacterium]
MLSFIASPGLTLALLCLFGFSIATATFIESAQGTGAAKSLVYNARWFEVVLGLFGLNLVLALRRWWPFRPRLMGFVCIHIAVIVILAGAAVTRYFGFEGTMYIREGAGSEIIFSRDTHVMLEVGGESGSFPVRLYRDGEQNISRSLEIGGETYRVEVEHFQPAPAMGEAGRAAVTLLVTDSEGHSATGTVTESLRDRTNVRLGDRQVSLGYGPVKIPLPFRIHLDDFVMITYPGSDNPVDYESHVRLFDPEKGIEGRPSRIFMNHPLSHRGYKHFQSSYDDDRLGTVLTVNFDPGKIPTYIGYGLITLGFILVFAKGLIWPARRSAKAAAMLALLALAALPQDQAAAQGWDVSGRFPGVGEVPPPVDVTLMAPDARLSAGGLIMQDYQGRMKPLDTLARALVRKIGKRFEIDGWDPMDMYLSWLVNPQYWWDYPLLYAKYPALRDLVKAQPGATHVSARSLFDDQGNYLLAQRVEAAHQTPDRDRSKLQRKLIAFDERLNLFYMALLGRSLRIFPVPGDENNTWLSIEESMPRVTGPARDRYRRIWFDFLGGLKDGDSDRFAGAVAEIAACQAEYGASVVTGGAALRSELFLNKVRPFSRVLWGYLVAAVILMTAYFHCLIKRGGRPFRMRHPLYLAGFWLFVVSFGAHLAAYVLRWVASGRAPLSNGYESLVFISLAVAAAGLSFELKDRRGVSAGLASLLTFVVVGISMMSFFDPAIGLLVPVLNSYWLNIHVTVITASYGFLGLGALIGALMLILYLMKGPGRYAIRDGIRKLEGLLFNVNIFGLGLLTVGTLLGGIWANESWGRYWGWDPKETWSLVTILAYTVISHIRLIPSIRKPWALAAGSFAGISTVVMTFFGVNYFLQGLHSYAQGGATKVPAWVYFGAAFMAVLIVASLVVAIRRDWDHLEGRTQMAPTSPETAN